MRLYIIDLGRCNVDKGGVLTPGSGDGVRIDIAIVGYLIRTDDGTNILVDTGMHRKHVADPLATHRGRPLAEVLRVVMKAEDDVVHRLRELGLRPEDIHILISTHFHFDHAGGHENFGHARIIAQRECYEHGLATNPPTRNLWDLPHLRYELVEGDVDVVPGVRALETPGHVPGHQSVLVRLPRTGPVILAIDAIYTKENLDTDNWRGYPDPARAQASARRLVELARREGATLIYGHDPAQWATLRKAPAYYD
ncbi:MAG: N-acyl homoserine lactonase family protein [Armatimonadetes bacterium]|nr:N-acyl homoserine lactonase family protein [Armatimonadota bacterium]